MSLKHKNTSKWAKQQKIYAQYSERAKDAVQEQLEINKQLTKRVKEFEVAESSEDENGAETEENTAINGVISKKGLLANNPWMKMMSGVGGVAANANGETGQTGDNDDYSKPKAFTDRKELANAQNEIDDESDERLVILLLVKV